MFGETMMVFCAVTAFGKTMQSHLQSWITATSPSPTPMPLAINTAMQRCLVKAIALDGIGLFIYAGEDLPPGSDARGEEMERVDPKQVSDLVAEFRAAMELDAPEEDTAQAVHFRRSLAHLYG